MTGLSSLPAPARYFPPSRGVYDVLPGLRPLGTDFGAGPADERIFQIDSDWDRYRAEKLSVRAGGLDRCFIVRDLGAETERAAARFIAGRLGVEYGDVFTHAENGLDCRLSGEKLNFAALDSSYAGLLDALACRIQEDFAVVERRGRDYVLTAAHVCFPSHWAPEEKIGLDFNAVHAPVAGFDAIARTADALVRGLVQRGPFVRFAWSLTADDALDHHPARASQDGRGFAGARAPSDIFLRVERQTTFGFPDLDAFLFTIRVYVRPCSDLSPGEREKLIAALRSMTAASRAYKSLERDFDRVIDALAG